jgi:hypothetical protein
MLHWRMIIEHKYSLLAVLDGCVSDAVITKKVCRGIAQTALVRCDIHISFSPVNGNAPAKQHGLCRQGRCSLYVVRPIWGYFHSSMSSQAKYPLLSDSPPSIMSMGDVGSL